ncbi:hypothetical protein PENTCL1PPCAC_8330, partial [Pristionchus entomophagus]
CSAHDQLARKVTAQVEVEGEGLDIRPAPIDGDFSETPAISRNVNPLFDERDPRDPSYHPKHYTSLDEELPEKKSPDQIQNACTRIEALHSSQGVVSAEGSIPKKRCGGSETRCIRDRLSNDPRQSTGSHGQGIQIPFGLRETKTR